MTVLLVLLLEVNIQTMILSDTFIIIIISNTVVTITTSVVVIVAITPTLIVAITAIITFPLLFWILNHKPIHMPTLTLVPRSLIGPLLSAHMCGITPQAKA